MALIEKVNGIEQPMSESEEAEIRAFWAENERKQKEEEDRSIKKKNLEQKFKDPYEALEKLCRHLKIDFETLEE